MEARLIITMHQETLPDGSAAPGRVEVEGPIDNKLLCYGLLRMAEHIIHDREPARVINQAGQRIVIPDLRVVGGNNKSNG